MKLNLLYRFKQFVKENEPEIKVKDVKYFWGNYSFTSKFAGQKIKKKTKKFQHYITDNNCLSTFQADLITYKFKSEGFIYVLLVIDQVSKFCFAAFFKRKKEENIVEGFKTIINEIRTKQNENILTYLNQNMLFLTDYGEEFKFSKVVRCIESNNSKIMQIGSPAYSKLGIIERAIRTMQEKLAFFIDDITNVRDYKKYFRKILKMYNNQYHTFLKMSPNQYIKSFESLKKPWNMYKNQHDKFNYKKNKKEIRIKLKKIKKKYKILQPVRIKIKLKSLYKRSHYTTFSDEIFFVDNYKIPLLNDQSIGIYLIDQNGQRKKGITYIEDIKKTVLPNYNKIKKIIVKLNKQKKIRCSFENFPNNYYRDIPISDLNQFIVPKKIRKEIDIWRKQNGF